jgi:hypothetical protein
VTRALLETAQTLGSKLMAVASLDDSSELRRVRGHEDAIRAFSLMDIAYEQCRRAALFLCDGVEDVEAKMPNYRAKRRVRETNRKSTSTTEADADPNDAVEPS